MSSINAMTLIQFREFFAKQSGRYDLINGSDWSDNGIDLYIRTALNYLDRIVETDKFLVEQEYTWNIGDTSRDIPFRTVQEVWVKDSNNNESKLEKLTTTEVRQVYPANQTYTGIPAHFVHAITRKAASSPYLSTTTRLLLLPTTTEVVTVTIVGTSFSGHLMEDGSSNFWTVAEPFALSMAVQLMLEFAHRNSSGANDIMQALQELTKTITYDTIENDQAFQDFRSNSWRHQNESRSIERSEL